MFQDNHHIYPTLGRIALDVLPSQASSVPCERLFSSAKQVADDRRSRLGSTKFEQLQIMKFAWRNTVTDLAAWNYGLTEEIVLEDYKDLLAQEEWEEEIDKVADEHIILH